MSYIGNIPTTVAFLVDTFSGNGSTTAFTLSQAPANTSSILVAVSGVVQDPSTYSVSGTTLTFSGAPPSGSSNISVRFLGIPASGVTTTAYRTVTEFTATSGQTTFSVPSYTAGYIDVYRNGVMLGSADYTATNGTSVILANPATAGDLVETISFYVSSVLNAIPATSRSITAAYLPVGTVLQVVNATHSTQTSNNTGSYVDTGLTASITPFNSSSKILVIVNQNGCYKGGSASNVLGRIKLLRNTTDLIKFADEVGEGLSSTVGLTSASAAFLDSPATESSVTYKTQFQGANGFFTVQISSTVSTITLVEIAA